MSNFSFLPDQYKEDKEIIKETTLQLIKDFSTVGLTLNFSGDEFSAYKELKSQVTKSIDEFLLKDKNKLRNILYIIDIPEMQYSKIESDNSNVNKAEDLADLILHREFIKVLTRRFFSEK